MTCSVPMVVASTALTGQTSSVPATTLYAPSQDGNYVVSAYVVLDPGGSAGDAAVHILWTDEYGSHDRVAGGTYLYDLQTRPIRAVAGQPIQFSVVYGSGGTPQAYDVFVTVVSL